MGSDLAIAIACNDDNSWPRGLAWQIADHYLADQLEPRNDDVANSSGQQDAEEVSEPPALTNAQLSEYVGTFFSQELDATYRFAVVDGDLVVRVEQEQPLVIVPIADDRFEFRMGWQMVVLDFDRNRAGVIIGFGLSAGSERGIVFENFSGGGR